MTNALRFVSIHPLFFVFFVAVLIRLALAAFFSFPEFTEYATENFAGGGDFALYSRMAENLISEGNFGGEPAKTYGSPFINPGQAFFLAGVYSIFGKSGAILILIEIFLGALIALGTYTLASYFFIKKIAVISGIVAAFWPPFLIQTFSYGEESLLLYTVLLLFGTIFFVQAILEKRFFLGVLSGVLLGFAVLVDSIAFFIPLIFLIWTVILLGSKGYLRVPAELKSAGLALLIFFTAFIAILSPWFLRNIQVSNTISEAPTISKGELLFVSPSSLGSVIQGFWKKGDLVISGLGKIFVFPYNISALDHTKPHKSYKNIAMGLLQGENMELNGREWTVLAAKSVFTLFHWLVLFLGFAGLWLSFKNPKGLGFLIGLLLLYTIFAVLGYVVLRGGFNDISLLSSFLFPLMPFLIVLASSIAPWVKNPFHNPAAVIIKKMI